MSRPLEGPAIKVRILHPWDVTPEEAIRIQRDLRDRVIARDEGAPFETIAGMDVSYDKGSPWIYAAIVVMRLPDLQVLDTAAVRAPARFPYIPGLLSFRESPAGLEAWERLAVRPDGLICDGHGRAHPRRFGLACHFGLVINLPTIGFAKRVLVGQYREPGWGRGSTSDLVDEGEVIGAALRTKDGIEPVFVSVGHRISLKTAIATVLRCAAGYRLPEPVRQAHHLVNRLRQKGVDPGPPARGTLRP